MHLVVGLGSVLGVMNELLLLQTHLQGVIDSWYLGVNRLHFVTYHLNSYQVLLVTGICSALCITIDGSCAKHVRYIIVLPCFCTFGTCEKPNNQMLILLLH